MKKVIHNLRSQPHEVKRHILHGATIVFAVILVSLWVWSLGARTEPVNEASLEKSTESTLQPFSVLKANLVDGYQSISE